MAKKPVEKKVVATKAAVVAKMPPSPEGVKQTPVPVVNVNIEKLVDKIEINTSDATAVSENIKDQVTDTLVQSLIAASPVEAKKEDGEEMEIVLTEEDLQMNPELVEHGLKVGDTIKVPVDSFTGKLSDQGHLTETMAPYLDTYPTEKEFHITSDGQVFLKANAADAVRHQKQLDDKEEVFVYVR